MSGGLQRVGFLTGIPGLLREMGVEPEEVVARAGIDPAALTDPENLVPYSAVGALLHEGTRATRCEHFGLRVGGLANLGTFGVIGQFVRNAPSFGAAVTSFAENRCRQVRGAVVYRMIEGGAAIIGYAAYQAQVPAMAQVYDCAVLATATITQQLSGRRPDEVLLPRGVPADPRPWHAAFKVPVRFNSERAGVAYPRAALARPVPGADPALHRSLAGVVDRYWLVSEPTVSDQVARLLRPRITGGDTALAAIAERLDVHPRTLNRRLQSEGTSFRELLNQTRLAVACQMLECTRLSVTQIGLMLNYADSAVFSHAFRHLTGRTPSDWRADVWRGRPPVVESALLVAAGDRAAALPISLWHP